jgi:hypothetical protein
MADVSWRILEGDCRTTLANLPAGSVQTCVTSPPYFGLRSTTAGTTLRSGPNPPPTSSWPPWSKCSVRSDGSCGMTGPSGSTSATATRPAQVRGTDKIPVDSSAT